MRPMSRPARFTIIACWLVVAFLLLRMAYGGSIGGIIYVVEVTHPLELVAGAVAIAGALAAAFLLARGATQAGVAVSIAVGVLAVPLSVLLITQDHGSAPVLGLAALVALALAVRQRLAPVAPSAPRS
jgi:hypothetical protein